MTSLGTLATGRDNNLNLIRAIAATAVLVSHAWPIALGAGSTEPLKQSVGHPLGFLAVVVFFAVSGFLITASFERSSSHASFLLARALRLFPGLIVNLALVAFLLGPVVTELWASDYLTLPETYLFFLRNLVLYKPVFTLPGVFEHQPFHSIVGSIWTLRHEVTCYMGVFAAGLLGLWASRMRATALLAAYGVAWVLLSYAVRLPQPLPEFLQLSLPFALGAGFHVWRDRLPMSIVGVALTAGLAWATRDSAVYYPALILAVSYATFWAGYVPRGVLRVYNRVGDYSYGIYLYAFPLQGWAVWAFGAQTPLENVLYSLPPTLLCAILSWHILERPALDAKSRILARLGRVGARPAIGSRPRG
ncbi:acyltransferase [Frigidibacter sp. MR17.14]|uniref:acyltransferase family protein n=1 Tax=Frigidibacter sp. MR17.14 TaxID=3126509 RepID=UPI0030130F80